MESKGVRCFPFPYIILKIWYNKLISPLRCQFPQGILVQQPETTYVSKQGELLRAIFFFSYELLFLVFLKYAIWFYELFIIYSIIFFKLGNSPSISSVSRPLASARKLALFLIIAHKLFGLKSS